MKVFDILRSAHHHLSHYAQFPALFKDIVPLSPNGGAAEGKSKFLVIMDCLYLFFVLKVVPRNYYLFGFNAKKREEFGAYMDEPVAPLLRHKLYKSLWNDDYCSLVNDKYLFHCLCRYHGIPVPEVYGIYSDGSVKADGSTLSDLMDRHGLERVILKPVQGMQGKGICFVVRDGQGTKMEPVQGQGTAAGRVDGQREEFIVQEVVRQHPVMSRINPHCLNTIRLITLLTRDNEVKFLAAMLRTGSGTAPVDNFSLGGIVIKVDIATGRLRGPGFLKGKCAQQVARHPLTGVVFEGLEMPHWNELKESVTEAQKVFSELKSVGWDLAVTPDGPVIIEGNVEWGTTGIQATNGGLLTPENRALFSQYGLTFHE